MKKLCALFVLCSFLLLLSVAALAWQQWLPTRVVDLADDATITVVSPSDGKLRNTIRLYGIDCPEHGQAFGNRARQVISDAVLGKIVSVQPMAIGGMEFDSYGRTVGIIYMTGGESYYESIYVPGNESHSGFNWGVRNSRTDPDNLNSMLVREGMAWVDPKLCTYSWICAEFDELEKTARAEKRGLWADENPVPPWEWRKNRKVEAQ